MELNPTQALGDPDSLVLFEQKRGKQTRKPYPVLHATINIIIIIIYPSLNREGRWGTTDKFTTSFLHFSLFSTAFWDLPNSRPVHFLMWSSHLFFCLPCLLPPFIVHCKMVLARPDERETCPHHCSLRFFAMVRSSCGPIACWISAQTSSMLTWSLYESQN